MSKKAAIMRYLTVRALRRGLYAILCLYRPLGEYLNYFQEAESFEAVADRESLRTITINPAREYGISYTAEEQRDLMGRDADQLAARQLVFKMARIGDVTVLGSSGLSIYNRGGKAICTGASAERLSRNWKVAGPLKTIRGDDSAVYINLLSLRKGHRHFAHFFWDLLIPLMVYLRNWHDSEERVTILVREDISGIQRDAYRFITQDYPNISCQTLRSDTKIVCASSIFIASRNTTSARDNTLARDYLLAIREMFARHYGISLTAPGKRRRLYIQRGNVQIRRVRNEPELLQILARHGFESCDPGGMSFPDQVALFASAEAIVAPHGSALTNLMFSQPGTKVLEFFPANYLDDSFINLSKSMALDYRLAIGGPGDRIKQSYEQPPVALEAKLREMLAVEPAAGG